MAAAALTLSGAGLTAVAIAGAPARHDVVVDCELTLEGNQLDTGPTGNNVATCAPGETLAP